MKQQHKIRPSDVSELAMKHKLIYRPRPYILIIGLHGFNKQMSFEVKSI